MIHYLTLGHLDAEAIQGCVALATKLLPEAVIRRVMAEFPGVRAEFQDGCVILPWHGLGREAASEEMAVRLQSLTGCQIADRRNGRLIEAGELRQGKKAAG
jgi:hypothetical protein